MPRDRLLIDGLMQTRWAMHRPTLERMVAIVERHAEAVRLDPGELDRIVRDRDARQSARRMAIMSEDDDGEPDPYQRDGNVGIVGVHGVISKYADRVNGMSQPRGITTMDLCAAIRQAGADRLARSVLLDIESPGGSFEGISDVAEAIAEVRDVSGKPIVALCHDTACSAAYWIASQCSRIYTTASGTLGSIGVMAVVEDSSEYYAKQGLKRRLIASGPAKGAGSDGPPMTEAHLQSIQDEINACAQVFVNAVALGRKMAVEQVAALADGSCRVGAEAVAAGLADEVVGVRALLESLSAAAVAA